MRFRCVERTKGDWGTYRQAVYGVCNEYCAVMAFDCEAGDLVSQLTSLLNLFSGSFANDNRLDAEMLLHAVSVYPGRES